MVCLLPGAIVAVGLAISNYQLERGRTYDATALLARQIAGDLDRELSRVESGLLVLATAAELTRGDLNAFHKRASDAVKSQIVLNYILTDREGRQLLNTLVPFGQPLPTSGTPPQLQQVFNTGGPVLTDMFVGPVTKKLIIAIGVPVYVDNTITYSLNVGLLPAAISEILGRRKLPDGWLARILDSSGTIVAHSTSGEQIVGQKTIKPLMQSIAEKDDGFLESLSRDGVPIVTSFCRSSNWKWTVAISAPKAILEMGLYRVIAWVAAGIVLAVCLGAWMATRLARRVISSVRGLNDAALAVSAGTPVTMPSLLLEEAKAVATALVEASRIMQDVHHRAYHDSLTGLANRALFEELLRHQFSLVERSQGKLAILALDLDGFKTVNDQQGHAMGDQVLRVAANRMLGTIRSSDTAARTGGDEFIIMLCDDDQVGAMHMAERLVAVLSQPYTGVWSPVSASVGVAVYPASGKTVEALLESADCALYRAKEAGKNRATIAVK